MKMDHKTAETWLAKRHDRALTEREQRALDAHLASCEHCRAYATAQDQLDGALDVALQQRFALPRSATQMQKKRALQAQLGQAGRGKRVGWSNSSPYEWVAIGAILLLLAAVWYPTTLDEVEPEPVAAVEAIMTPSPTPTEVVLPTIMPTVMVTMPAFTLPTNPPPTITPSPTLTALPTVTPSPTAMPTTIPTQVILPSATPTTAIVAVTVISPEAGSLVTTDSEIIVGLDLKMPADGYGGIQINLIGGENEGCTGMMSNIGTPIYHQLTPDSTSLRLTLKPTNLAGNTRTLALAVTLNLTGYPRQHFACDDIVVPWTATVQRDE